MRNILLATAIALAPVTLPLAPSFAASEMQPVDMSHMQPMTMSALQSHVGQWIYDKDGVIIGNLVSVDDTRQAAVVQVSTVFFGGSKNVEIPLSDLGAVGGRVIAHDVTYQSLEDLPHTR